MVVRASMEPCQPTVKHLNALSFEIVDIKYWVVQHAPITDLKKHVNLINKIFVKMNK